MRCRARLALLSGEHTAEFPQLLSCEKERVYYDESDDRMGWIWARLDTGDHFYYSQRWIAVTAATRIPDQLALDLPLTTREQQDRLFLDEHDGLVEAGWQRHRGHKPTTNELFREAVRCCLSRPDWPYVWHQDEILDDKASRAIWRRRSAERTGERFKLLAPLLDTPEPA